MNKPKPNVYEKYYALDAKIKKLQEEQSQLKLKIVESLRPLGEPFRTRFGAFTIAHSRTWIFSPQIQKLEKSLREAKTEEQKKGIAQIKEEKEVLRFIPTKKS